MTSVIEKALRYRRVYGTRKMIRDGFIRLAGGHPVLPGGLLPPPSLDESGWVSARELVKAHRAATSALQLFPAPRTDTPRVSLVTDSINKGSLYGGVGTAIILASLIAEVRGATLRVITRTERPVPSGVDALLGAYGITVSREMEFAHAPHFERGHSLNAFDDELFLTTSWWTTAATLGSVRPESILYLLQEDERMFYPHGDELLQCNQVLQRHDIRFAVNTRLLRDHLVETGLSHFTSALSFEPAFPVRVFYPRTATPGGKRTLMFYARPHNQRNLFLFGLDVIEAAISRGILDLAAWDILLIGKDIPRLRFDDGRYTPKRLENLSWTEYAETIGRVDLGLSLMYTPHPSYPPFDLAASGAVVLTNCYGGKQRLDHYCANIVCREPALEPMLDGLAEGIRLAGSAERTVNYAARTLNTDWKIALRGIVQEVVG
jgi:hypothetical protein